MTAECTCLAVFALNSALCCRVSLLLHRHATCELAPHHSPTLAPKNQRYVAGALPHNPLITHETDTRHLRDPGFLGAALRHRWGLLGVLAFVTAACRCTWCKGRQSKPTEPIYNPQPRRSARLLFTLQTRIRSLRGKLGESCSRAAPLYTIFSSLTHHPHRTHHCARLPQFNTSFPESKPRPPPLK
jgi:hypothetical protein